jgi:hypothetical protein
VQAAYSQEYQDGNPREIVRPRCPQLNSFKINQSNPFEKCSKWHDLLSGHQTRNGQIVVQAFFHVL